MPSFNDHFSDASDLYARYRPTYPDALFAYVAGVAPSRRQAWDCGTGSGQAARGLAPYFDRVLATDGSAEQIAHAPATANVTYAVAVAEASPLDDNSVDLITVAQALHWFDREAFYAEARRVLRPDGVMAVWTYNLLSVSSDVDAVLMHFHDDFVAPYWPEGREHTRDGYRSLAFPFDEFEPPAFRMTAQWSLEDLTGYLSSWSATRRYREAVGTDPVAAVRPAIRNAWGADEISRVTWPLSLRIGRKTRTGRAPNP